MKAISNGDLSGGSCSTFKIIVNYRWYYYYHLLIDKIFWTYYLVLCFSTERFRRIFWDGIFIPSRIDFITISRECDQIWSWIFMKNSSWVKFDSNVYKSVEKGDTKRFNFGEADFSRHTERFQAFRRFFKLVSNLICRWSIGRKGIL